MYQIHRFLGGIIGKRRQLLAIEIAHLGTNIELSIIAKTMLLAFSQAAGQKNIRDYFKRGYEMSLEHVEYFLNVLKMTRWHIQARGMGPLQTQPSHLFRIN
ncbi:DUF3231 family protein [Cytobacillus firmus]|uniref:DUF3231 family protein n=1 Tax=Cytobacillus firmus TaxID=1399 RepID=UPI00215DB152|nr:DUF3231 family protein [Cytobacillus firmus]